MPPASAGGCLATPPSGFDGNSLRKRKAVAPPPLQVSTVQRLTEPVLTRTKLRTENLFNIGYQDFDNRRITTKLKARLLFFPFKIHEYETF